MSEHSQVEWTDAMWNPVRGCTKITPCSTMRRTPGKRFVRSSRTCSRSVICSWRAGEFAAATPTAERTGSGRAPDRDPCSPADVSATIFQALGVGPASEILTASGRRMPLFRDGQVIEALLA